MAKGSRSTKSKKAEEEDDDDDSPDSGQKDVSGALSEMEDGWEDTEEKSFEQVPDGKYQVKIESAVLNHSKKSGRFQCSWTMVIVSGEQKNRKLFKHDGLDDDEARSWFKGSLAKLGIEWPKKASELPDALEELLDTYAQVTVRTKGDFNNTYFDKALDTDEIEDSDDDASDDEDEKPKKGKGKKPADDEDEEDEDEDEDKKGKKAKADDEDAEDEDEDEDEDEEPKGKKEEEPDEDDAEDEEVSVKFDDKKLSVDDKKNIKALAKKHDFDPGDYNTLTDLLCDVAEHCGVTGEYKKPADLIAKVTKVKAK